MMAKHAKNWHEQDAWIIFLTSQPQEISDVSTGHGSKYLSHSHFWHFFSHSQWPNPSPSDLNPIFPGQKQANPSSHFTPQDPHDRGITLQAEFLSTSTALELKLFNCVLFYRTKFVFLSPFYSHSLLDRLNYFLLISQVKLISDVAHQMYRAHHYLSGILSCALIIALSMLAWDSGDRAAFKDNLQASFLAVCCSTLSCDSGCKWVASRASFLEVSCLNTGVAQVRKDSSQVRTSITVF